MSENTEQLRVLLVVGNCAEVSTTRSVVGKAALLLQEQGCAVDIFDFAREELPLFNVETAFKTEGYAALKQRLEASDVLVIGTPDYHGSMSSAAKNFLDHFWKEYAGKLVVSIVGSYEKGLTVHDQIRTVARQCYAWTLPYGLSFHEKADFTEGAIMGEGLATRLGMMTADIARYGALLARQRRSDLASEDPGFLAHYRG